MPLPISPSFLFSLLVFTIFITHAYVSDTIKHELERNKPLVDRILSDITYQSADNLVDGLTKLEEEGYNYAHYYGAGSQKTFKDDYK